MFCPVSTTSIKRKVTYYGCWYVAKINIFVICFIFVLQSMFSWSFIFIIYIIMLYFIIYLLYIYMNVICSFVIYFYFHIIYFKILIIKKYLYFNNSNFLYFSHAIHLVKSGRQFVWKIVQELLFISTLISG